MKIHYLFLAFTYPYNGHTLDYRVRVRVEGARWKIKDVRAILCDGERMKAPEQMLALDVWDADIAHSKTLLEKIVAEVEYQKGLGVNP